MDAQIKDIKLTSAHRDKEGDIDRDEFATLTLHIPMDTESGRRWVAGLLQHLSREYVAVEVTEKQMALPGVDIENQLATAKEVADSV